MVGTAYVTGGEIDTGIECLRNSLTVARDTAWLWVGPALGNLGSGLGEIYELERSERYLREHMASADAHDLWCTTPRPGSRSWSATPDAGTTQPDGAGRALTGEGERLDQPDQRADRARASACPAGRSRRGRAPRRGARAVHPGGHLQRLGHVRAARAEAAWLAGDRERAAEEARAAAPLALEKRHLWFAGELAYWQRRTVRSTGSRWIAEPYRLELEGSHEAAAAAWRERGCTYEAARALEECCASSAAALGVAELEQLGAAPAAQAVRQQLRRLGAAVPRGRRPGDAREPAELTARELDVLRLVVAGRRNAEIADDLVLSTRTVDHHVSAILRKLGVRSRGDAAIEGGLLDG